MRDILLIGINSKYIHSNLAIRYMASYADLPFFECTVNDDIFSVYSKLVTRKENYFCFSVYIWNVEFIKNLCSMLHSARPDIKIILGGPEAGYNKEYFFDNHPFVFGIVTGEGEEFAKALKEKESLEDVPNLSFRTENKMKENKIIKTDLSCLKFPYKDDDLNENLENRIVYFETSRGCIFNCAYCLSSAEGKTRFFPIGYVKDGLKKLMDYSVPLVKFVDRTFNENNERAKEIVSFILENNKETRFHFEIAPQLLTKEFVNLCASKPEWFQFEMGIQTTNKDTMRAIKRVYDLEKTANAISEIPNEIHCHLDLIAGLPYETFETFKDGFNYVYMLKPDMLQVGFLKLLKHTSMYNDAEKYDIKTTSFPPFEVLSTHSLSYTDLLKIKRLENAVDRVYNSGAFKKTLNELPLDDPFDFYMNLGNLLYEKEMSAPISRTNLYEFMYEILPDMKKSLSIDFIKNNRKAKLPVCFSDEPYNHKEHRKLLSQSDEFKDKKFKLIYASDCVFLVSDDLVEDVTHLVQSI